MYICVCVCVCFCCRDVACTRVLRSALFTQSLEYLAIMWAAGTVIPSLRSTPPHPNPSLIKTPIKNRESRRYFFSRVRRAHAPTRARAPHPTEERSS